MFSMLFFAAITIGGTVAFFFAMRQIIQNNTAQELSRLVEQKSFQLKSSVDKEIVLAVKMADSSIIKRHFVQPENEALKALAFEEIAAYREAFTGNSVFWISDKDKKYYFGDEYIYDASFYLFNDAFEITGAEDKNLIFEKKKLSEYLGGNYDKTKNIITPKAADRRKNAIVWDAAGAAEQKCR
jgi:hypothetical protein